MVVGNVAGAADRCGAARPHDGLDGKPGDFFRRPARTERCVLMCSSSSKASAGDPPALANSMNTLSYIRGYRLQRTLRGPYSNGVVDDAAEETAIIRMRYAMPIGWQ
jgi:hypothetical protein